MCTERGRGRGRGLGAAGSGRGPRPGLPGWAMLRTGTCWGAVGGGVALLLAVGAAGRAVASTAIGVGTALAVLSVAPVLLSVTRRVPPSVVLVIALTGYALTVVGLWLGFVLLNDVPWVIGRRLGYGLLGAGVGAMAGQLRALTRARILVYDESRKPRA